MVNIKVETGNGIYEVKKPSGTVGAIHIGILTGLIRMGGKKGAEFNETDLPMTPAEQENLQKGFLQWTKEVLPHIYVNGPFPKDDMPGEDQFALFFAMFSTMKVSGNIFRIITE